MKLFKFISSSGIVSRRKAQESIQLAMVTVNNVLVMDPFEEIDPVKDDIRLDDQKIILNSSNTRSEDRRVGNKCRSRWSPYQ